MNKEYVQEFYNKLRELEDEYGLYVKSQTYEDYDYDMDDNLYMSGWGSYLNITDADGLQAAYIFDEDEYAELRIDEDNCE